MQHMFWPGPTGSEIYCDLDITTLSGLTTWDGAIEALKTQQPFLAKPLYLRGVVVDFAEVKMRRMVLTLDPESAMHEDSVASLVENEERLRKRILLF